MGSIQFIWFQGLSSPSVCSVDPDLHGAQLVLLPSHLYLQMSRHPLQVPKTLAPNSLILKKGSVRVIVASAHKNL